MKNLRISIMSLAFTMTTLVGALALADKDEKFNLIHVPELQNLLAATSQPATVFDANNEKTRKEFGVVHGAKLLASSSQYDLAVLPKDKSSQVVFYCANTECSASHTAAKRAVEAGYTHVAVFADGIQGWKKAGLKTDPYTGLSFH